MSILTIKTTYDYEHLPFVGNDYIFRGHSKESYLFLPGSYRSTNNTKNLGPQFEIMRVQLFIHHLRQRGYHTFSSDFNEFNIFTTSSRVFPTHEMLPYFAVAQHYAGDSEYYWLTTSLLDVTYSLDIATYFAVKQHSECNGKIFIIDKNKITLPYEIYEPNLDIRKEARMVVQNGAFIYRKQEYESEGEMYSYKDCQPFDDIVSDTLIIPSNLKDEIKEHLRIKLFDKVLIPKLILGPMKPDMSSIGKRNYDEMLILHKAEIERCKNAGNRHSNY
jgi:hypothetical protein